MNRNILAFLLCLCLTACSDDIFDHSGNISIGEVTIALTGIDESMEAFEVQLRNTATGSLFTGQTDARGTATFSVTPGIYEASVTARRSADGYAYIYNGTSGQITVLKDQAQQVSISVKQARTSQLVIKELYNGGCIKDDGVTTFHYDKCLILYNNSPLPASVSDLCIGAAAPANAQANNKNYTDDGQLVYEPEGFIPVWNGLWYFPSTLEIEPYEQVVVNIHGAIDNTLTVSNSVNYANKDYYCMYDPESGYYNTNYYPTPSDAIPTSHYLKAIVFGLGNGWPFSTSSPALIVFQTKGVTPREFAGNTANLWYSGGEASQVNACVKVPNEWIIDAVEVYSANYRNACVKRLTSDIDAGYVWLTNLQGHTLYRNVDQDATEALTENNGRLVYNYALGVDGSTDPSGIDAEASIRNGARIVYQDTNNSTNDFHERQTCSLRN